MSIARRHGLNEDFIRNVFIQIHDEAIRLQSQMLQDFAERNTRETKD
jgi:hypothetical protein